jgi:putative ABC transport system permease protein
MSISRECLHAVRRLRRAPGFVLVAILSLGLALGFTAAVFSIVQALFGRDLPLKAPEELVALSTIAPERPDQPNPVMLSIFEELKRRDAASSTGRDFAAIFAWRDALLRNVDANGVKGLGTVNEVSGEYFAALGVQPLLGRTLTPDDVASIGVGTSARVAVLDYRCWEQRFARDPHVLGKTLTVDGTPLTIVGVMPEGFVGLNIIYPPDAIVPIGFETGRIPDRQTPATPFTYYVAARLTPGTTVEQAAAHVTTMWPSILEATVPPGARDADRTRHLAARISMESLRTGMSGSSNLRRTLARPLTQLMALSALVLIVACLNLANLVLTRATARRHELGVHASLGASRWVLTRSIVAEGVLLSLAGAALGLASSLWISPVLLRLLMASRPLKALTFDPTPDLRVVAIGSAAALVIGIVCALLPAWRVIGRYPLATVLLNARGVRTERARFQKLLICTQVALALMLTAGAVLFARSLYKLHLVNPGFRAEGVLQMQMFPQVKQEVIPNRVAYYRELATKLSALPGVDGVAFGQPDPLSGVEFSRPVSTPGSRDAVNAVIAFAGPDFFRAMGMTVTAGREFEWRDDEQAPHVAVISQSFAARRFPGIDPIGQTIDVSGFPYGNNLQIIGVVNSASLWRVQSREPSAVYIALMQASNLNNFIIDLHTAGDVASLAQPANRTLESLGRHYSFRTEPLTNRLAFVLRDERTLAIISTFLAAVTILLAAAGLYGLLSYMVTLRQAEIGIRVAIGAQRRDILLMVLREAAALVIIGIGVGAPMAFIGLRLMSGVLFGVSPGDPVSFAVSVAGLASVTLIAAYLPARRACRMDPLTALRLNS